MLGRSWLNLAVAVGAATCAAGALVACDSQQLAQVDAGQLCTTCGGCAESRPVVSAAHVTGPVDYPDSPPASGPHDGRCWSSWGVQDSEVPAERWVHNLEHGGVVFLYRCDDGCEQDLVSLRELVDTHERTLLTAYSQLPTRFAVVAWGVRLLSDCLDLTVFESFYAMHFDHAPESLASGPAPACARSPDI